MAKVAARMLLSGRDYVVKPVRIFLCLPFTSRLIGVRQLNVTAFRVWLPASLEYLKVSQPERPPANWPLIGWWAEQTKWTVSKFGLFVLSLIVNTEQWMDANDQLASSIWVVDELGSCFDHVAELADKHVDDNQLSWPVSFCGFALNFHSNWQSRLLVQTNSDFSEFQHKELTGYFIWPTNSLVGRFATLQRILLAACYLRSFFFHLVTLCLHRLRMSTFWPADRNSLIEVCFATTEFSFENWDSFVLLEWNYFDLCSASLMMMIWLTLLVVVWFCSSANHPSDDELIISCFLAKTTQNEYWLLSPLQDQMEGEGWSS